MHLDFIVIDGVTIIETVIDGTYHVIGDDYTKSADSVEESEELNEEWKEVIRIFNNMRKIPKKGHYYTLKTRW